MATPTIATLTPAVGPVVGDNLIRIVGTNFQLPPAVPLAGPAPETPPTVRVLFGIEPALEVQVLSSTLLHVSVPAYHGAAVDGALPPVNVTVENIDVNGVLIPGETITATEAYVYERPLLHGTSLKPTTGPAPETLVAAALINAFRRQVLANTVLTTHVDYAEDGTLEVQLSKIPAIILQGPTLTKDLAYWHNESKIVDNGDGTFNVLRPPYVARATFTIVGVTDNEQESLNMQGSIMRMFNAGKHLGVDLDPENPDPATRVDLVLQLTAPPSTTTAPGEDNIRTFAATCEVRGIEIYETDPVDRVFPADEAALEAQQLENGAVETIPVFP